jgi:multiple sugar transport system permease protein
MDRGRPSARRRARRGAARVGRALAVVAVVVTGTLPLVLIVKQAITPDRESSAWPPTWIPREPTFENFRALATAAEVPAATALSVGIALAAMTATVLLALPAAWLAARDARASRTLDRIVLLARVFPQIALAIPLAVIFVRLGVYNRPTGTGLLLAHVLLGLPLAFLVLRAGFGAVPRDMEEAALLDGATPARAFIHVTLPLVRPQLATAALLLFLLSWDEFGYALLLQITNRTLPPLLYYLSTFGFPGLGSAIAVVMLVPALIIVVLLEPAFRSGLFAGSGR